MDATATDAWDGNPSDGLDRIESDSSAGITGRYWNGSRWYYYWCGTIDRADWMECGKTVQINTLSLQKYDGTGNMYFYVMLILAESKVWHK